MKNQGALCALFGGAIWGLSGTCGQFLFTNSSLSPLALTWIRMLIAGIVLTLLSLVKDREKVEQIVTSKKMVYVVSYLRLRVYWFASYRI